MPQIKFRGVEVAKIQTISKELVDQLQKIIQCPREDLTLECQTSTFIQDGNLVEGYPFVEVAWFDRGQSIQDQVANVVTEYVQQAGYPSVDVIFFALEKSRYYENGKHY